MLKNKIPLVSVFNGRRRACHASPSRDRARDATVRFRQLRTTRRICSGQLCATSRHMQCSKMKRPPSAAAWYSRQSLRRHLLAEITGSAAGRTGSAALIGNCGGEDIFDDGNACLPRPTNWHPHRAVRRGRLKTDRARMERCHGPSPSRHRLRTRRFCMSASVESASPRAFFFGLYHLR
jgi:hypothetical protein